MNRRMALSAAGGAVLYGGWGYLANMDHGVAIGLRVGLAQGAASATITLCLTALLEYVHRKLAGVRWRRTLTVATGLLATNGASLTLHLAIGTPRPLVTMGLSFVIGTVFVIVYVRAIPSPPLIGGALT